MRDPTVHETRPVLITLAFVALLFWPTSSGLIVSGVLSGIGHGFIFPILSVMLIERAREENRGSAITLFTMLYDLGLFIGAPLLGLIANVRRRRSGSDGQPDCIHPF